MSKKNNFSFTNRSRRINLIAQVFLGMVFILGLNFLAAKHYIRYDFSRKHRYALSPESVAYIKQLKDPVEVIVMLSEHREGGKQIVSDLKNLLKEFSYNSRIGNEEKIYVKFVDVFQQRKVAEELVQKYNLPFEEVVIVACKNQHQILTDADLYQSSGGAVTGFKAEQSLLSTILDVSSDHKPKVGVLTGHGEMRADDVDPVRGLSKAADVLRQRNILLETVDLMSYPDVPDDIELLIIAGQQVPVLPEEAEKIRRYVQEHQGRLLVFLSPGREHGLGDLFHEWGIRTPDMVILDTGEDFQVTSGDMIIRRFAEHPITQIMIDFQLGLVTGLARPVDFDWSSPVDDKRKISLLLASSDTSWAESDYRTGTTFNFNEDADIPGPVGIGVVSEEKVSSNLGINIPTGRIIVVGNSDLISNNRIAMMGNGILFLNAVNWSLSRDHLLNIAPKKLEWMHLTLSRNDMWKLAIVFMLVPVSFFIAGMAVYFVRKK